MKSINLCSYIAFVLIIFFSNGVFSETIQINTTYSSNTVISPFQNGIPLWSLTITGSSIINDDYSLIRVILTDVINNEYLVYESYGVIDPMGNQVSFENIGIETSLLDSVVPVSIKIEVQGGTLTVNSITCSQNYISCSREQIFQHYIDNVTQQVDKINQNLIEKQKPWYAGITGFSRLTYTEKKEKFGISSVNSLPNLQGYEYYAGGIFVLEPAYNLSSNNIVEHFDWRDRHGTQRITSPYYAGDHEGWIPPLFKGQGCYDCWIFSPMLSTESNINLYFNNPQIDMELSGQDALYCAKLDSCRGSNSLFTTNYLSSTGMLTEIEFPYWAQYGDWAGILCATVPSTGADKIKIAGSHYSSAYNIGEDSIKELLITKGPLAFDLYWPWQHTMSLVGFGQVHVGDTIKKGDLVHGIPALVVLPGSPDLGKTFWIFKQSIQEIMVGGDTAIYIKVIKNLSPTYDFINTIECPITNIGTNPNPLTLESARIAKDEDGDGYFWWGIGTKPSSCPLCPDQEDCDDSDPNIGPYDNIYNCTPFCNYENTPLYITSSNFISDYDRHFNRDVIIEPGSILNFRSSKITFAENVKIIVKPGGRLLLNECVLTSGCNTFWSGIEVWGNREESQYTIGVQGEVVLNNATIENAINGITTIKNDTNGFDWSTTGGVITANNSTFKNNKRAIQFLKYKNFNPWYPNIELPNLSYFNHCSFVTDSDFKYDQYEPECFVSMYGVSGIKFLGCSFSNSNSTANIDINQRGIGINSIESNYLVDHLCATNSNPCELYFPSTFSDLYYGISALGIEETTPFAVANTSFTNNYRGVYCGGVSSEIINNNIFLIPTVVGPTTHEYPYPYGVYLDRSSGFQVEENQFAGPGPENMNVGILINNSGKSFNEIYHNSFTSLSLGTYAMNNNRGNDADHATGLKIKCNNYFENIQDILVDYWNDNPIPAGISQFQGYGLDTTAPVGNTFTHGGDTTVSDFDNRLDPILYFHHNCPDPNICNWKPKFYTTSTVTLINCPLYIYNENSCPSHHDGRTNEELRGLAQQYELSADTVDQLLQAYVDGGNTNSLQNEIQTSTTNQALQLRSSLLNKSPYLSDTVMSNAVKKEDVLLPAMVRDVLVANPQAARSKEVNDNLDARIDALPDYMRDQIIYAGANISAKEILEAKVSHLKHSNATITNRLIRSFLFDTLITHKYDSIIPLLSGNNNLTTGYSLAFAYLRKGDSVNLFQTLQNIPFNFILTLKEQADHEDYVEYFGILQNLRSNHKTIFELDSSQKAALYLMAYNNSGSTSGFAKNILMVADTLRYEEPIVFPQHEPKSTHISTYHIDNSSESFIRGHPNPAKNFIVIEYGYMDTDNMGTIQITDAMGRLIKEYRVTNPKDQIIFETIGMSSGIYFCSLYSRTKKIVSQKFTITN